jgi:preprotein translocase subunit SecF
LLTVVGYAINNVVVVFDRVRENLIKRVGVTFEETIDKSINQTLTRCLNTSITTILALLAILFFGGDTLKYFSLALIMGIAAGTYSSVFLAGPLLTIFRRYA